MENIIYYFSGRGNSLSVAKGLAERLPNASVIPMASAAGEVAVAGGSIGLVFPVIDLGIPNYVRRFVKRLKRTARQPYVFAVITCGGMPGSSLQALAKLMKRQGVALATGWIMKFGLERWTEGDWHGTLNELAGTVRERTVRPIAPASLKDSLLTGLANPLARFIIPNEDRKFRVDQSCDGCGVCVSVCPVSNIEIRVGRPQWLHRCEQCAACFSWCPKAAISGSCLAARTHYTNPQTKLEQMLRKAAEG